MLAGPTELVLIAGDEANVELVAADLLAQAEHGADSAVVSHHHQSRQSARSRERSRAPTRRCSQSDRARVHESQRPDHRRAIGRRRCFDRQPDCARASLPALVRCATMARSHRKLRRDLHRRTSPVAAGDYIAGPNHVLPTGGTARFTSPLGVYDFVKRSNVVELSATVSREIAGAGAALARFEGLPLHARSLGLRGAGGCGVIRTSAGPRDVIRRCTPTRSSVARGVDQAQSERESVRLSGGAEATGPRSGGKAAVEHLSGIRSDASSIGAGERVRHRAGVGSHRQRIERASRRGHRHVRRAGKARRIPAAHVRAVRESRDDRRRRSASDRLRSAQRRPSARSNDRSGRARRGRDRHRLLAEQSDRRRAARRRHRAASRDRRGRALRSRVWRFSRRPAAVAARPARRLLHILESMGTCRAPARMALLDRLDVPRDPQSEAAVQPQRRQRGSRDSRARGKLVSRRQRSNDHR